MSLEDLSRRQTHPLDLNGLAPDDVLALKNLGIAIRQELKDLGVLGEDELGDVTEALANFLRGRAAQPVLGQSQASGAEPWDIALDLDLPEHQELLAAAGVEDVEDPDQVSVYVDILILEVSLLYQPGSRAAAAASKALGRPQGPESEPSRRVPHRRRSRLASLRGT
jgi:hypothetical protein